MPVLYRATKPEMTKMTQGNRNSINIKSVLAAIVVGLPDGGGSGDRCNLKVLMDGYGELWLTDVPRGTDPGQWQHVNNGSVDNAAKDPVAVQVVEALPVVAEITVAESVADSSVKTEAKADPKPEYVKPKGSWGD